MSRIGKLAIAVPDGVTVDIANDVVTAKGKLGELKARFVPEVIVEQKDKEISVKPKDDSRRARSMWGMTRSQIANLVEGVSEGFTKDLTIQGVGYRANLQGDILVLALGYSHDILYAIPTGITINVEKQTSLSISGANKQLVGQVAAEIRSFRPPEPYKGKGVRYANEYVRMKEGKKK